jgi:RND family efflux transporter MFP subunit
MRKAIGYQLTAISLASAVWTGCGQEVRPTATAPAAAVSVRATTAAMKDWPDQYEATGTVRARTSSVISAKVMAYVRTVPVQVGDRVRAGQELVTLEAQELDAGVRRAEAGEAEVRGAVVEADHATAGAKAALELAQTTFRRMEELASKKSISNQEFDEASARLKSAEAAFDAAQAKRSQLNSRMEAVRQEIRTARVTRDYARIAAPFAGLVTAKSAEPGNLAAPGSPLLTIEREGSYRLEASADESKLPLIKSGGPVEVELESLDRRLTARVSEIVPAVDASSRAYTVKIDLPSLANVRSGMFGRARFPMAARKVLAVPAAALVERGQLQSVFVVENGIAHMRLVTTGGRGAGSVEVLSGLSEGEKVVHPVPAGMADGARIEVQP